MRIFVFEHVVGGGLINSPRSNGLVAEGGAMLHAAVCDFLDAGHQVATTLDARVKLDLASAAVTRIRADDDPLAIFDRLAAETEVTLVIAPESDRTLRRYIARLDEQQRRHLGCSPEAIDCCADKLALARHLAAANIATPPASKDPGAFDFPMVAKPRFGAGCEHVFIVRHRRQLDSLPQHADRIYQPYAPGMPVSASCIIHDGRPQLLLAGEQILHPTDRFSYAGGRIPLPRELADRANHLAQRAVEVIPGLRGFVGLDLVLADDPQEDTVIEINPRLTVSFVALRLLGYPPLAQAMLDPAVHLLFPDNRVLTFDPTGLVTENPTA